MSPAYFPPSEAAGGWRRLVQINTTPTSAQKTRIRTDARLDWDKLKIARDYSESKVTGATILVIGNGWIAAEWGSTSARAVASVSKSLTAVLIMDLIEAAKFSGLDAPVHQYLPPTGAMRTRAGRTYGSSTCSRCARGSSRTTSQTSRTTSRW